MIYGQLEIEIMNSVWSMQDQNEDANISINDVVEVLNNNNVERAYTTIKTVMDRLVTKGILVRYKNGKKFFYKSTVDKEEAARKMIETVSNQMFNGDLVSMLRFIEKKCEKVTA